jgi:hypothetical protein
MLIVAVQPKCFPQVFTKTYILQPLEQIHYIHTYFTYPPNKPSIPDFLIHPIIHPRTHPPPPSTATARLT